MIKVTLEEIINATPALETIAKHSFNGVNAFKIARLIRELNKETELFETERRKLIEKYCERGEDGSILVKDNNIRIQSQYIENYNNTLMTMLASQVEINASPLSLDTLEMITLTPQEALSLEKFFDE